MLALQVILFVKVVVQDMEWHIQIKHALHAYLVVFNVLKIIKLALNAQLAWER